MSQNEPTLYVCSHADSVKVIISLYVDDLLFTGSNDSFLTNFKLQLMKEFEMTNLGEMQYFLRLQFIQNSYYICIHQSKYAYELLKRFQMDNCKAVETPIASNCKVSKEDGAPKAASSNYRSIIDSLLYLTASRPDLMYPVSLLSRFMQKPS